MKKLSIEERLGIDKFSVDDGMPHIVLDKENCTKSVLDACVKACPAGCYVREGAEVKFDYVGCLECGTCRVLSQSQGLKWEYPRGTFGVEFRYG